MTSKPALRWTAMMAAVVTLALGPTSLAAAPDFKARANGHVYRCGSRVVDLRSDGPATLTRGGDGAPLVARSTRWSARGVVLGFGAAGEPVTLSAYGSTISLAAASGGAVCVEVR